HVRSAPRAPDLPAVLGPRGRAPVAAARRGGPAPPHEPVHRADPARGCAQARVDVRDARTRLHAGEPGRTARGADGTRGRAPRAPRGARARAIGLAGTPPHARRTGIRAPAG